MNLDGKADDGEAAVVTGDLTTSDGCQALVDSAVARFGGSTS